LYVFNHFKPFSNMSLLDTASLIVTPNGYKEGKLYSVIPSDGSGDMSVTRATTATRVNSAGLVELVPYNYLTYSQNFDNAAWDKQGATVTANDTTAPDGTMTADKVVFSGANKTIRQALNMAGATITASVYIKGTAGQTIGIDDIFATQQVITLTGEWQRVQFTAASPNGYGLGISTFGGVTATTIWVWGAQLVEGSVAKDYQKTETRLNIPRLDYSNGTCPSLLVEPQRTNLALYSSSFDNSNWNKTNCSITANNTTAPDGTTTADKLILANGQSGSSSDGTGIRQFVDIASGSYTYSIYAKAAEFTTIRFRENQVTGAFLTIDLTNGAITNGDVGQYINPTATLVSNGWYRITFQTPTLTALYKYSVRVSETGNGTSGIFIWGYQVELGSYATSYIPTTSASVTRNADVISKTGISSLIGQTEGTLFVELDIINGAESLGIWMRTGVTPYNDMITILVSQFGTCVAEVRASNVTQFTNSSFSIGSGKHKFALAYKANDFAFYIDGTQIATSSSGTPPTCDQVYLGGYPDGSSRLSKNAASALWQTRLTNTQLAQLTTI
jgi:hypothetical protein